MSVSAGAVEVSVGRDPLTNVVVLCFGSESIGLPALEALQFATLVREAAQESLEDQKRLGVKH